jgi:ferredoxin
VEHVVRVFPTFGYEHPFARGDYERTPRRQLPLIDVEARELREEVELRLPSREAALEGSRCLHCWVNTIFDSSAVQGTECIQCGGCVDVCPEQCIDLVSIRRVAAASELPLAILPNGAPASIVTAPNGAVLLKDETACIRCGLCARRCPAGTITMQAFYRTTEASAMRAADAVI